VHFSFLSMIASFVPSTYGSGPLTSFLSQHSPRLYCYLETPGLLWSNLIMDALIAASYAVLFGCLTWIAAGLRKFTLFSRYLWIFVSFGLFIVACGGTHLMEVLNLWWPRFGLTAGVRVVCAAASVPTAILFAWATPSLAANLRSYVEVLASTQQQRDAARGALTAFEAIAAERRQAAKELAAVNQRLHSVMNSTSELILQISPAWKILYGNREAAATLPDFHLGANVWTCFSSLKSTTAEKHLRDAMEGRTEQTFDNYYEPYDTWYRTHAFPAAEGISIFSQNITAEKKLEESLARERSLREKHVELMSHMAGGLAHEISNPLAIIHARASDLDEVAASGTPPSATEVRAACDSIVRTSDRAMRILRGLRGLSREASNDPMEFSDIVVICEQALELQATRFKRHQVEIRLTVAPDIPLVFCRETQIGQVVSNLLNNGFDAIMQSTVTERWISIGVGQVGENVYIRIGDSGPKIDLKIRARMMEPFFTTKKAGLGTGVGLSLSHAIADGHRGSLTLLEGTANTCFEFLIPITHVQGSALHQEIQ
jgi:signal transduction histidine kinase